MYEDEYESLLLGPYMTNVGNGFVVEPNDIGVVIDEPCIRIPKGLKVGSYNITLHSIYELEGNYATLPISIYVEPFSYYSYYVQTDERQCVVNFGSTGPHNQPGYFDKPEWKLLTDKGKNYQFTFEGEENPYNLFTNDNGTPLFKWENNALTPRTSGEIEEDEKPYRPAITDKQRLEALEIAMLEVILNGNVLGSSN